MPKIMPNLVGRKVHTSDGYDGIIVKHEPLSSSMCDVLVERADGYQCRYSSSWPNVTPLDGIAFPTRAEYRQAALQETLSSLEAIKAQHIRDFHKPWRGAEFAKAIIGNAIVGAIERTKEEL